MNKRFLTAMLVLLPALMLAQRIRIELTALPAGHPAHAPVFLAGSFNGWNPADPKYRFTEGEAGKYYIEVGMSPGNYEFKITRGGWDRVECGGDGQPISNRILSADKDQTLNLVVAEWQDLVSPKPKVSTASRQVRVLDTAFYMPQLKRYRRVWIYLPSDYAGSKKRYPVLYLQDGQNVFDDSSAYSGEWGVDEMMDTIRAQKSIVVAIDHGGPKRLNEYCPYPMERFGKGEGNEYLKFLVKKLKPYIDRHFRTLRGREHTFIAGSSMGGLISMYALLKYPKKFGGAGVFSPAFWVAPAIYEDISARGDKVRARLYFLAGKKESESMVTLMLKAVARLNAVSHAPIRAVIREEGRHNEASWRRELPLFYEWLMQR